MSSSELNDIAVIGLSGKFPGAKDVNQFWNNIKQKKESISFFDDEELHQAGISAALINQKNYIKAKGYLEDAALFDAKFFNFSAEEATFIDPQLRIFIELCWEALENAAYLSDQYSGRIGVFASSSSYETYYVNNILPHNSSSSPAKHLALLTYNAKDFLATWVAYKLNLTGPCVAVQTACSSSLVTICMACDSLLNQHCEIALAGGISITTPLKSGYVYQPGMIFSQDGHCRAFDAQASGSVVGNGGGVLVLKRLADAQRDKDYIHAIIKGYHVNNDGHHKIGFTAPSVDGQIRAISAAIKNAKMQPQEISYIEAHGTGTTLGDAVEFAALAEVFSSVRNKSSIGIGSVKPNIGHLDVAAGVASTIKMVQALKNKTLPPMLHFERANSQIELENSPFYFNSESLVWGSQSPRAAGVSSFGMGGTNAHLILQEYSTYIPKQIKNTPVLLILSAMNLSALIRLRRGLSQYLLEHPNVSLAAVAYTLQIGRKYFEKRFACICSTVEEAVDQLNRLNELVLLGEKDNDYEIDQLKTAAKAWLAGEGVDWKAFYTASDALSRLPLPTYPFERREFWISPQIDGETISETKPNQVLSKTLTQDKLEQALLSIFRSFLGMDRISSADDFFDFGGDSLLSLQLLAEVEKQLGINVSFDILKKHASAHALAGFLYHGVLSARVCDKDGAIL